MMLLGFVWPFFSLEALHSIAAFVFSFYKDTRVKNSHDFTKISSTSRFFQICHKYLRITVRSDVLLVKMMVDVCKKTNHLYCFLLRRPSLIDFHT